VQGAVDGTYLYVERGYQRPDEAVIILLVLGALGGVLMLGGTLTATFLALSDARPDLATLSAVGAAPRSRRRVAAAYALVIGFVGAVLGAGVRLIPGIAISRPLTAGYGSSGPAPDGPFLAIPWLLIGAIVLALPLLTAAVVGLSARSRLPLVARLD
jgi:putative ABC transport system permease protein